MFSTLRPFWISYDELLSKVDNLVVAQRYFVNVCEVVEAPLRQIQQVNRVNRECTNMISISSTSLPQLARISGISSSSFFKSLRS